LILFLYYGLLLVVFLGTVVGATLASTGTLSALKRPLLKSMGKYNPNSNDPAVLELNAAWDQMQGDVSGPFFKLSPPKIIFSTFQVSCCGVSNYSDWQNAEVSKAYPDSENHLVPMSCCSGIKAFLRVFILFDHNCVHIA